MTDNRFAWGLFAGILSFAFLGTAFYGCRSNPPENSLQAVEKAILEIGDQSRDAVVVVEAFVPDATSADADSSAVRKRLGSGFVYRSDGIIVTTDAVLDGAAEVKIITQEGDELPARVLGRDFETNLSVLQVSTRNLRPLQLIEEDIPAGCLAIAVGNTYYSQGLACSWGLVNRTLIGGGDFLDHPLLAMNIPLPEVGSGVPILDARGALIGITEGLMENCPCNWTVIPATTIRAVADRLIAEGEIVRGWLGIKSDPRCDREEVASLMRRWKDKAVVISEVIPGSPAQKADLQPGDIISEVNGESVTCVSTLRRMVTASAPGTEIILTLVRGGSERESRCALGTLKVTPDRRRRCSTRDL